MKESSSGAGTRSIVSKEKDGLFQIYLNSPPDNLLSLEMIEQMNEIVTPLVYRTDLKLIVFSGNGKTFCGGFSPGEFEQERSYQLVEAFGRLVRQLHQSNIPVVSVVQGLALGAGFELVVISDLAIAAESAKFGLPDIKMGLFPPLAANILQRSILRKKAAELILTGDVISAKDAEKDGIINRAVADDQLQAQASLLVGKLLQFSAPVLQLAKKAMSETLGKPLEVAIGEVENIYLTELLTLEDSKEGVKASIEKRKPVWKNQ